MAKEVEWIGRILAKALDIGHQIDLGNTKACADVAVEDADTPLLKSVPTTSLLHLEHRIDEIRALVTAIPTLDPAKGYRPDPEKGKHTFKAREVVKDLTKKVPRVVVLHAPTPQHPAQTQLLHQDVSVGKILEKEWSGLIHPATKAEALDRVDKLARAVKKARARANDSDLDVAADRIGKRVQMLRRVCVMSLADAGTVLIKDGQAKHAKGLLVNAERVQFHKNVQTSLSQITQALMREPEAQNEAKKADTNRALLDCKTRNAEGKLNPAHYSCGDVFAAAVAICSLYLIASSIAAARCTAAAIYGYNACTVKVENGSEG